MKQRGRQSRVASELQVIAGSFGATRPDPPDHLTKRSKEIWQAVVQDEAPTHFSTAATRDLLKDYCHAREWVEILQTKMTEFPPDDIATVKGRNALEELRKTLSGFMRDAVTLATKLRITNQSRYTPRAAQSASANTLKGIKPWEL
jgi:phage terminase small subunit